jgi:uncharacterized membrane protein affecting hemolysin expression
LNHMSTCSKPSITKDKASKGFVRITFQPDLTRFVGLSMKDMMKFQMITLILTLILILMINTMIKRTQT